MATFKYITTAFPDAASNTSLTSAFTVPGEFSHFAVEVPAGMLITATGNIRIYGANSATGTFREVVYSNNPSTATSGNSPAGEIGLSSVRSGAFVITEGLQFVPFAKFFFTNTCTANTGLKVYGRKFD